MQKLISIVCAIFIMADFVSCEKNKCLEITIHDKNKVIWENKYVSVLFTEYNDFNLLNPYIKLKAENKSDIVMYLFLKSLYINDYYFEGIMNKEIAAGETTEAIINIKNRDLEYAGISKVGKISLWLMTNNPEKSNFDNLYINSEEIIIKTNNTEWENNQINLEGEILYEQKNVKIKQLNYLQKGNADIRIPIYIENNTDNEIYIAMTGLRIDGKKATPADGNFVYLQKNKKVVVLMSVVDVNNTVMTEHFSTTEVQFTIITQEGKNFLKSEQTKFKVLKDIS